MDISAKPPAAVRGSSNVTGLSCSSSPTSGLNHENGSIRPVGCNHFLYNSRGFRTWNTCGHPSGLGKTTDRTSGRSSTSERNSDKSRQHRTGKSAGQHDGFTDTATRSDGTTERFSEGQVVASVLDEPGRQVQRVIGMAIPLVQPAF